MTRPPQPSSLAPARQRPEWQDRVIHDTGDLAVFLDGSPDSFTGLLLNLIAKADNHNITRLLAGFPREVFYYMLWQTFDHQPTYRELAQLYDELERRSAALRERDLT